MATDLYILLHAFKMFVEAIQQKLTTFLISNNFLIRYHKPDFVRVKSTS